jgi:hypothetical protein
MAILEYSYHPVFQPFDDKVSQYNHFNYIDKFNFTLKLDSESKCIDPLLIHILAPCWNVLCETFSDKYCGYDIYDLFAECKETFQ